ncbi:hypothetical protein I3843_08G086000 [Carya illinoinensis]|nr:hypothetical protein I3760_08G090300 [Carya illinoinensis]KAG7967181.1 hypothetical protein I3843_08G086000 [Carya illinoinensis]
MDEFSGTKFNGIINPVRKKRTQTSRRPRLESQPLDGDHNNSPFSPNALSDDVSKVSSDDNAGEDTDYTRKEFDLNLCVSRVPFGAGAESQNLNEKNKRDGGFNSFYNNEPARSGFNKKRSSEGVLAPANWKSTSKLKDGLELEVRSVDANGGRNGEGLISGKAGVLPDRSAIEKKVKKVKLKVGGVTHTIQANATSNGSAGCGSSAKRSRSIDASRPWQKQNLQGNLDDNHSSIGKRSGLQGIPRNDFSRGGRLGKSTYIKEGEELESVRKGKRVTKRHVFDEEFGGDDEDDEIRYLEKLKTSMSNKGSKEDNEESGKKHRKLSGLSNMQNGGSSRLSKGGKRSRLDRESEGRQLEEESGSDGELEGKKKKKQMKESADSLIDNRREITLTTRQRALQSSKDAATGKSFIEFPDGLPPAPPRKQKEKLSELEQQLKKAEAAQRRRMQVEKAARESEAEAIRKILGQDSSRKKREEKLKKRNEELAKEKAANAMVLAPDTVRWVMRPTGTVVTFSENVGLPTIFDSKPHGYPPPRENCVGPSCNNPFRYRDSRSKLPLCSLQCYKAIREKMLAENTPANVAK